MHIKLELAPEQLAVRDLFRAFVRKEIAPFAQEWDRTENIPRELLHNLGQNGWLLCGCPVEYGGKELDAVSYGLLQCELGGTCTATRCLVTVHDMVAQAILRWGSKSQRDEWLPRLASGQTIAAFALSEPLSGSDAASVSTTATDAGDGFLLTGTKRWITGGMLADVFLVLANYQAKPTAFLVARNAPGLSLKPICGMLGARASMLAEINFDGCIVPRENIVGGMGFGLSAVMTHALEHGRYCVAWGSLGLAEACLAACMSHVGSRRQFGKRLIDHQLVRKIITELWIELNSAALLCQKAGQAKARRDPGASAWILAAKYAASKLASRASADAVQLHGALGYSSELNLERFFRDARLMEIIEGTSQIIESIFPHYITNEASKD